MMKFLSKIKANGLKDKICLLRLDFNTQDNWRMQASLPTIKFLEKNCQAIVIVSHKGRPVGYDESLSLRPMALALRKTLKKPIIFIPHFRFQEISRLVRASPKGTVFLLENLRFLAGEEEASAALGKQLSMLADIYVNDAFAVSHRANASVVTIAKYLPSYAGLEMEAEISQLSKVMKNPEKPLVVILGGAKIQDKLKAFDHLKTNAKVFLIGGALNNALLNSLKKNKTISLPADFIKENGKISDIGPKTIENFCRKIKNAKTIIWNGPLGNIDDIRFRKGTIEIAKCLPKNAFSVVGGGETVMFLKKMKLDRKISFLSTGGGAMLEFLSGKKLPGIKALEISN